MYVNYIIFEHLYNNKFNKCRKKIFKKLAFFFSLLAIHQKYKKLLLIFLEILYYLTEPKKI